MALKDLVRKGPAPKPRKMPPPSSVRMNDALKPFHIDPECWLYEDRRGILVVHEIKDGNRFVRTDQFHIPWSKVFAAAKRRHYTLERDKRGRP